MIELRKDYLLDRWVLINNLRRKRPFDHRPQKKKERSSRYQPECPFCPGNEETTPPEILRIGDKKSWTMRIVPNKFPGFFPEEIKNRSPIDPFLQRRSIYGYHELLIETPRHDRQFWDFTPQEILGVLKTLKGRVLDLRTKKKIKEVVLFKNHGERAGASLVHSHFQIMAYNDVSHQVLDKIKACQTYRKKHGKCCYCQVLCLEADSPRLIEKRETVVAIAPYASLFPYQATLLPVRHVRNFLELTEVELLDTAILIHGVLSRLKKLEAPYNLYFQETFLEKDFHFHVEITPRLNTWGGFELQTGIVVNTVSPEEAARFFREV